MNRESIIEKLENALHELRCAIMMSPFNSELSAEIGSVSLDLLHIKNDVNNKNYNKEGKYV